MKDKIKQYLEIEEELEDLALEIFEFTKKNHIGLLAFGKHSGFDDWELSKNHLSVKHCDRGYDLYEYSYLRIPLKHIYDNTWKEYIQDRDERRINNAIKKQEAEKQQETERELKLLEELKKKYNQ